MSTDPFSSSNASSLLSSPTPAPRPIGRTLPEVGAGTDSQDQAHDAQGEGAPSSHAAHNPYLGHRHLTPDEAHLLGEYYRLSQTLKRILQSSGNLSATKLHAEVLDSLRQTERKMGLVITLFKASVWSIMVEQEEKLRAQEEARRVLELEAEERERRGQYHGGDEGDNSADRTVTYGAQGY